MTRISSQPSSISELAVRVLSWLLCAQDRFTIQALQEGLSIELNDTSFDAEAIMDAETLAAVCGGLVTVDAAQGIIHLAHHSVLGYLEVAWELRISSIHTEIAFACLNMLSFETHILTAESTDSSSSFDGKNFLSYAQKHWANHTQRSNDENVVRFAVKLLSHPEKLPVLAKAIDFSTINEKRSGISIVTFTGLHIASLLGLSKVVSALGSIEADINKTVDGGWTALHCAAANGHYEVVQLLLDINVSWKLTDSKDGWTALHLAVRGSHERIVQLLLKQGAIPDPKDIQGRTPLHLAAWAGDEHSASRLLTAGADVCAVNSNGGAALHWAARGGHKKTVEALLKFDADIDAIDHTGSTALHDAVRNDQQQVEQLLVNRGANRDIKDFANRSAAELAWSSNGPSRPGKPSTFDWSAYETDEELSGQTRDGTQAVCRILRKKGDEDYLEDGEGVDDDLPEVN